MSRILFFFLIWLVLPVCPLTAEEPNPLLEMIGKKYADYFDQYEALNDSLFFGDSLARKQYMQLLTEAAAADPTGEWELNRRFVECQLLFYESRDGGFIAYGNYTAEDMATELVTVAREARKKGFLFVRLRALFKAADAYRIFLHEYEKAFAYYLEVAAELEKLSHREFPWKLYMYREIANFYASFREYTEAARFYHKIIDDPDVTYKNNYRLYPALHGLAECYRHAGQYEQSDSCFLRILELSAPYELDTWVWEGIAKGNIGYNYYLRGDMDKALAWMVPALAKMKRPNDDPYTSALAANIANIYLLRNDVHNGKKYLDIALDYHRRTRIPEKNSHLLEVTARYHILQSDRTEAIAYLDSTLRAKEREQEAFSGLVLRRVEQQLRASDQRAHERELDAEILRSKFYRHTSFWVSITLVVILLLLLLLGLYHRRIRQAYHELVIRSQQWAGIGPENSAPETPDELTPEERATAIAQMSFAAGNNQAEAPTDYNDNLIMETVKRSLILEGLYKRADLTLDKLAVQIGLNRGYLSGALNRCTGKNFNAYVNEFRVKEAIRLISEHRDSDMTIESIAYESGFNDRSNFYRTFKKLTGLSPTDFRKNLNGN